MNSGLFFHVPCVFCVCRVSCVFVLWMRWPLIIPMYDDTVYKEVYYIASLSGAWHAPTSSLARESARQRRARTACAPITHFVSHTVDIGAAELVLARGKSAVENELILSQYVCVAVSIQCSVCMCERPKQRQRRLYMVVSFCSVSHRGATVSLAHIRRQRVAVLACVCVFR